MGVCDQAMAAEMGEQEARKRETTFSSVVSEAYRARVQRIEPIGETPCGMPLGMGRDGEACTKGWLGVHTRTYLRALLAPVWLLAMRHCQNNLRGHALTVGMTVCIVCVRSRTCPFFGGHVVAAGTKCTCVDCLGITRPAWEVHQVLGPPAMERFLATAHMRSLLASAIWLGCDDLRTMLKVAYTFFCLAPSISVMWCLSM